MGYSKLVEKWMNKWPVLFFSFSGIRPLSDKTIMASFRNIASETLKNYGFLVDSPKVSAIDRQYLHSLADNTISDDELPYFASKLCSALHDHKVPRVGGDDPSFR